MIPMATQIEDFEQVAANLTERLGEKSAAVFLEKSLVHLIVGSNDIYPLYYLLSPGNSTQKDEVVVLLLDKFKHQIEVSSHPLALSIIYPICYKQVKSSRENTKSQVIIIINAD